MYMLKINSQNIIQTTSGMVLTLKLNVITFPGGASILHEQFRLSGYFLFNK